MIGKQKSIKINFIMNAMLSLSSVIFPMITTPYVSRALTPAGTGKVSTAISFIAVFIMFSQLGIPTYGIRVCSQVRDDREKLTRMAHELFFMNLVMTFLMYAVFFIMLPFAPVLRDEKALYVVCSTSILLNAIGMEWLYKALEQYTYITVRSLVFKVIALVMMFMLIHSKADYVFYGLVSVIASSASNVLNLFNIRKYIDLKPIGSYDVRRHLKPVGIFFAMACATTIYTNLDRVMLRFMTDDTEVGLYDAAIKIKYVLVMIVTSLGAVLLPRVSYYIEHDMKEEFRNVTTKALKFVYVFALATSVYFIIMARQCIMLLNGELYMGAVVPMMILVPTVFIIGLSNLFGIQMLVPLGREKEVLIAVSGGAVIDIVVNAILIGPLRSSGASVGTLVAEIFVTVYLAIVLRKELSGIIREISLGKILISLTVATSVMIVALYLARFIPVEDVIKEIISRNGEFKWINEARSFVELAVTFLAFSLSYVGMLYLLREDLTMELLRRRKHNV